MSYYEVSVLITILVTSLIAFYLLYKAKELNLGILLSISIGSIILGFTFSPVFKAVLRGLGNSININKKLALAISILTVLFVSLLLVLIVSFIISICIPDKLTSIDCCSVIDSLILKIKDNVIRLKGNLTAFLRKIVPNMKEIVKNVYNLKNKLKKPVDTKQIIDTMGIEKSENDILADESINKIDIPDSSAVVNLLDFMEPSREVAYANQEDSAVADILVQTTESSNDNDYNNLLEVAYQEVGVTQIIDAEKDENSEIIVEEVKTVELSGNETTKSEVIENEASEVELNQMLPSDANDVNFVIDDEVPDSREDNEEISEPECIIDADFLVLKAFESKDDGRKEEAIEHYIEALQYEPNNEMIYWIVLDVCALYKQLGLNELAKSILQGLDSEYGSLIRPEVKMEIMNNLK